ncbi:MAG: SDR family oxidoreductase [Actinomycetota bacterium]|nr:SDR family oxidoreductase [Actinomycetota bacterium]
MASPRKSRSKTIAVTGAAGYIAGRLIEALCSDDRIDRVLGFDVREPDLRHDKFVFDEVDARNEALKSRFEGVDVVVHLAFIMDPIKDEAMMRDVNVHGSQNVFRCAGAAGVKKLVYTSSATVYGAHPDNDLPLTEDSPLRANLDFSYPAHKLEVEYVVREFREEFPNVKMTVFRPAIVFGPNVDNAWSHALELPVLFGVKGYSPPIQFVHEDDVGDALRFAVFEDLDGNYNLAAEGWLEAADALRIIGRRRLELSEANAFSLVQRLWDRGWAEAPAGMLHYLMHPWVVSGDRLTEAGFRPERTNEEALAETASGLRSYVRVGRRRLKKKDVAAGAAAGLGVIGTVAAVRTARSRG